MPKPTYLEGISLTALLITVALTTIQPNHKTITIETTPTILDHPVILTIPPTDTCPSTHDVGPQLISAFPEATHHTLTLQEFHHWTAQHNATTFLTDPELATPCGWHIVYHPGLTDTNSTGITPLTYLPVLRIAVQDDETYQQALTLINTYRTAFDPSQLTDLPRIGGTPHA